MPVSPLHNLADTDWDNTMIRLNFDQTDIGSMVNLKDNVSLLLQAY